MTIAAITLAQIGIELPPTLTGTLASARQSCKIPSKAKSAVATSNPSLSLRVENIEITSAY
jgi:hypothetical protein